MDPSTLPGRVLPGMVTNPQPTGTRTEPGAVGAPTPTETITPAEAPPPSRSPAARKGPFRSRAQETTVALLRAADLVRRRLADVTEAHDITWQQYNVLRVLRGAGGGPLRASEIAHRLIERTPGTTRLLDRLEERRLIRRERDPGDRRAVLSWLTDEGEKVLGRLDPLVDAVDAACVGSLADPEQAELIQMLTRLRRPTGSPRS